MKRLLPLSVSIFALAVAGCGKESDERPVDGRDFDGVGYSEPVPYTGKVIDGYLRNARVWLDIDGDSQYTPGPLTVELASGTTVTLASGEPTAMSGEDGAFTLEIEALVQDSADAPDIDPRDYPLYALALPGKTVEQLPGGDRPVDSAYMMSATPGVRQVTPLTTLARYRGLAGAASLVSEGAGSSLAEVNLLTDYIRAGDPRAHGYARAFARFMAGQFPEAYNEALAKDAADGTERFLSPRAAYLLGLSLVQNAAEIVAVVDDAASQGGYANVDTDSLVLPEVDLELSDPVLLTRQVVSGQSEYGDLPANRSSLLTTAELSFDYGPDGRLMAIASEGCMTPSMPEIARLINVGGRMADLDVQWLPSVSLSLQSRVAYDDPGVDERLSFDWANRQATFETTTQCQDGLADASEFGGPPEITYSWAMSDGRLEGLAADSALENRTLEPDYTNGTPLFNGYRLMVDGVEQAAISLAGASGECAIDEGSEGASHVVSAQQAYSYAAADAPDGYGSLALEFDTRGDYVRLLRYSFTDPKMSGLDHVSAEGGFDWIMFYPQEGMGHYVAEQPNLIADAYLTDHRSTADCGREFEEVPFAVFGRVSYQYQRLSDYLTELVE
ncbi:hypothetical protein ACQUWM_05740 [Marinobacter sp. DUT-3]|uniref:hypothetical protein n=1 Tax=Marinobacter sp. DUT-3 TaxID=3412036 RepID=UPI003D168F23